MKKHDLVKLIQEIIQTEIEEANYPEGFNVQEFKALPSFASRLAYARARLPRAGRGSSRAVFFIDDATVLKVAMNKKGKAQNDVEADIGTKDWGYPVARVYEVGDQGAWIEMQRAKPASTTDFKRISGIRFGTFGLVLQQWEERHKANNKDSLQPRVDQTIYDSLTRENQLVIDTIDLMGSYDMAAGDFSAITSWGVVNDSEEGEKLVLIDFGLTHEVFNDFYVKKNLKSNNAYVLGFSLGSGVML